MRVAVGHVHLSETPLRPPSLVDLPVIDKVIEKSVSTVSINGLSLPADHSQVDAAAGNAEQTEPAAPSIPSGPAAAKLLAVSLATLLPAASRTPITAPVLTSDGPAVTSFFYPTLGGWVMTPDNVKLILSVPSRAELVILDTTADKERKRIELDFKPSKLAIQGDTLFAAVQGGVLCMPWI